MSKETQKAGPHSCTIVFITTSPHPGRFTKYDSDNSGNLPADQLKLLLTDINAGFPPSDHDVQYVLNQCEGTPGSGIDLDHLKAAIACWFDTHEDDEEEEEEEEEGQTPTAATDTHQEATAATGLHSPWPTARAYTYAALPTHPHTHARSQR